MLGRIDHRGDKAELLLAIVGSLLASQLVSAEIAPRGATSGPRYQIHVHDCPSCHRTTVQTPQGELELSEAETETIRCDAQVQRPGQRNSATIAPSIRREVLARDRHQCRRKGCEHTRHLDIHHLEPRANGGRNDVENLVTLCPGCHHLWHRRGGDLSGLLKPQLG